MLSGIFLLPFNVLVVIPFIILCLSGFQLIGTKLTPALVLMVVSFILGAILMLWTMRCFARVGRGSPAPWDPIDKLITTGPYAYSRNPMLTGVFLVLLGESLLFQSWPLFYYLFLFVVVNILYFKYFEEKGLAKRYGQAYEDYKNKVPRFIPKFKA